MAAAFSDPTLGPLTEAQLGIWLGHQRARDSSIYNAAECTRIEGPLEVEAFRNALTLTLEEADSLRIAVSERNGRPELRSLPGSDFQLEFEDLSAEPDPQAALRAAAQRDLATPFSLLGPLSRHRLFRLGAERHAWLHVGHHLALDGYAFAQFGRRLSEQYATRREARPLPRAFSGIAPVLAEDRRYQASAERELDGQFWSAELDGFTGVVLGVPDATGPARGRHITRVLATDTSQALSRLASELKTTLWNVFIAAVAAECHARTGISRLSLGLPVMLRFASPAARTPCMAMNIVAVPLRIDRDATLASLVREVHTALARQRKHQRFRYEHLKAARGPARAPAFGPVVNVMPFTVPLNFGPCRAELEVISQGPVEDVAFSLRTQGEELEIGLDAHPAALDAHALAPFLDAFLDRLRTWVDSPSRTIEQLSREVAASGATSSTQVTPAPAALPPCRLINAHASTGGRLALVAGELSWDYVELDRAAKRCARKLLILGAREGALVALDLPRGALAVVAVLGALYAGAGYVALERGQPLLRRQALLEQARPSVLVTEPGHFDLSMPADCARFELDHAALTHFASATAQNDAATGSPLPATTAPESPAYVVFTSGSTGAPKGVVVSGHALAHFVAAARTTYDIQPDDRVLQFAPLGFDASVEELFVTWTAGATLVLRDDAMLDSMSCFFAACRELDITVLDLPTAFFHELALALEDSTLTLPPRLRLVIIGGEAALPERVLAFRRHAAAVRLLNTYGPSEATVVATVADLWNWRGGPLPIGRPLPGVGAVVINATGAIVPEGAGQGELYLSGPTLAAGYLGRDDLTRERFVTLPGIGRVYRTGDRVTRGDDGQLSFVGRVDDELKISGHRVVPAEVEAAIASIPGVRASCVIGHRDAGGMNRLLAYVEVDAGALDAALVRRELGSKLPAPMIPSLIELRPRLPRTIHGKLDRKALAGPLPPALPQLPLDAIERDVVRTWQEVLGCAEVGLDQDFFEAGGSSLQVIQLANRLCRHGHTITVAAIFRHPTARAQAQLLRRPRAAEPPRAFVPRAIELLPSAFAQRRAAPTAGARERVFLTGATGFLGLELLMHWLSRGAFVTCAVRASAPEAARKRLLEHAARSSLDLASFTSNWEVCCLDLADPALTAAQVADLVTTPTLIFHAAAEVSLTRDYASLFAPNVIATKTLLELAAITGASFHHVSTLACLPADQGTESFFPHHSGLRDGYQQSKWQAETLCERAGALGLRVAVYRVGRLTGSRLRPVTNAHDLVWRIARAATRSRAWPDLQVSEPWLPVDTAAERMVALARTGSARSPARVYHVLTRGVVALERVRHTLTLLGFSLPSEPLPNWAERVARSDDAQDHATLAFFELAADASDTTVAGLTAELEQRHTHELLPDADAAMIDEPTLLRYCRSAVDAGVLAPAASIRAGATT
jgi:nonribosomal peptide synthetase MxcG